MDLSSLRSPVSATARKAQARKPSEFVFFSQLFLTAIDRLPGRARDKNVPASGEIEKRDCFDLHMRNAGLGFVRDARSRLGSLGSGILSLDWNQKKKKEAGSKAETTPLITEPASSVL